VEKIPFIHSSTGVYYHYYPFFLSKLTKEGQLARQRSTVKQARRGRSFVCQKKEPERRRIQKS
jgi:hypothetical protein